MKFKICGGILLFLLSTAFYSYLVTHLLGTTILVVIISVPILFFGYAYIYDHKKKMPK